MEQKWEIKLSGHEEVEEFVNSAGKCEFDIDIFHNRRVIDAKSILGVLSLDLTQILTVRCFGRDDEFESILKKYCTA